MFPGLKFLPAQGWPMNLSRSFKNKHLLYAILRVNDSEQALGSSAAAGQITSAQRGNLR